MSFDFCFVVGLFANLKMTNQWQEMEARLAEENKHLEVNTKSLTASMTEIRKEVSACYHLAKIICFRTRYLILLAKRKMTSWTYCGKRKRKYKTMHWRCQC